MERLQVHSDLKYLRQVRRWVADVCASWGLSEDATNDMRIAVGEAFTNCVVHAYGRRPDGVVVLTGEVSGGRALIRVRDCGNAVPIDPDAAPDLDLPHEGGYGVYLMKRLTDGIRFVVSDPPGTEVVLVKNLPEPAGER
ncbi:MAG: ATP-binding protein [Candidatus Eisenbacteria bacterium]|nr:ATP-binding protein [Candidatus Eisenbacteria bacterium]